MISNMRQDKERQSLMLLNALPGLSNRRIKALLDVYERPSRVCAFGEKFWTSTGFFDQKQLTRFMAFDRTSFLKREIELMSRHGTRLVTFWDEEYPEMLKNAPDAPLALYVRGNMRLDEVRGVAVVGSRRASLYGRLTAEKFSAEFAQLGLDVISGLARGIDTAAHTGSLRAKGRTIAVLGSGLARIYPDENFTLSRRIERDGLLISEFPMRTEPFAYNFPRRNRIISGLSLGVLVVEAARRSGALITASFALEQGKDVFAVPGQVNRPTAQGVHHLIRQGAKLVGSVQDILEELVVPLRDSEPVKAVPAAARPADSRTESQAVLEALGREPVHFEQLLEKTRMGFSQLASVLLGLEMKKTIKRMPGQCYVRGGV